jgi:uncharacterized membrane protein
MDNNNFNGGSVGSSNNDTGMAIVAYILFFIPLIFSQNRSAFLNFHINQGLILFVVSVILGIVASVVNVGFLSWIFNIFTLIMIIMGIMNAAKGETKALPLIGNLFNVIK